MSQLSLEGIVKRYGDVTALDGMALDVAPGEFHCLFGPSAAGKTTTLRVIAGLERVAAGSVTFEGADITTHPVQGRDMAMIFQTFALYPHLSTRDNLAYPLRRSGLDAAEVERRVGEVAEMLKVGHAMARKPATLSGGEQQRVAIGRALVGRPKLLLLDEPLTNLDAKLRHDMRAEFKRLHRELGMTMVYATPDQLEALTMGERITVIDHGSVVQCGTPEALFDEPRNEFVGRMIGAPQMNLIPASVEAGGGRTQVATAFATLPGERWHDRVEHGEEVWLGLRPHDLAPRDGDAGGPVVETVVHLLEPLGDITIVDLEASDVVLRMVLPEAEAVSLTRGQTLQVELTLDDAHLFHRETGVRVG